MIGILGGMGPRATVQFHKILFDMAEGDDQSLPAVLCLNDGNIPDRSTFLMGNGKDPIPAMIERARVLESAGATLICVPCNTAQTPVLHARLTASVATHIVHMPSEVVMAIKTVGVTKVLLLATEGTIKSGMYQQLCAELGIDCLVPRSIMQAKVMRLIRAIKSNDRDTILMECLALKRYVKDLKVAGVILGCTELPLVAEKLRIRNVTQFDSLAILATACLKVENELKGAKR